MRMPSGAKESNHFRLSLIILIILGVLILLFSCSKVTPNIEIAIGGEGVICAGARLPVHASILHADTEKEEVRFEVIQEGEYAYFEDEMLVICDNAPVGAVFEIAVYLKDIVYKKQFTVVNVPVESLELLSVSPMRASESCTLEVVFSPLRAMDNELTFELLKGTEVAEISGSTLTLKKNAKSTDSIVVVAKSGGKVSNEITVSVVSVFAEELTLSVSDKLYAGESVQINSLILPENTNEGSIVYVFTKGENIASINADTLSISAEAEVNDEVVFFARIGEVVSNTITLKVQKKAAKEINLFVKFFESLDVKLGDSRELYAEIFPLNTSQKDWSLEVLEGEEFIEFTDNMFTVLEGTVGDTIKIKAVIDSIESEIIVFTIVKTPVEKVEIFVKDAQSVAVAPGETRRIIVDIFPVNATFATYELQIEQGEEFIEETAEGFVFKDAPVGTEVSIRAYSDGTASEYLIFTIVPIPVESIEISTNDAVIGLKAGDTVNFTSCVYPFNATYGQLSYKIISGEEFGEFIQSDTFVVFDNAMMSTVLIQAVSADGVESNIITLEIEGVFHTYTPNNWKQIDNKPNIFDGYSALLLNLSKLPLEADNTTIVFSSHVQYLIIEGGYSCTAASCINNLNMYFLTAGVLNVVFRNLGIEITERFGGTVIDFGTKAEIILTIEGDCSIEAGSPYAPYVEGFTVDGEWSTASTNYIRKHGMDGFGGYDGGTAISANNLTIKGEGKLTVKAGSGSSGTNGGKGADVPLSVSGQKAGNGGRGGYGGNSGFAIFANKLTFDLSGTIYAYGGNGGKGGEGGEKGLAASADYNGSKGITGADGIIHSPIYAFQNNCSHIQGLVNNVYCGQVEHESGVREESVNVFVEKLEKYFKIDLHYGTDFWNPYKPTLFNWSGKYKMTQQNDTQEILKLLHGLEGALCIFPKNMYIELSIVNTAVNIYLVNTIKNSADNTVYGLTSNVNNIWFATFDTRLRDTFYSTYYNIMIHEILHLLTFSMGNTKTNPMRTALPQYYNLGYAYTLTPVGVYDPQNGYGKNNSAFLTRYSKTDFNEDISDNISMICVLSYRADFLEEGTPIYLKSKYIANTYRNFYNCFAYYMPTPWERFTWEY